MCRQKNFLTGVLELTVFYPGKEEARFIGNRLEAIITELFDVRIHPHKGISRKSA